MSPTCDGVRLSLGAYALGALEPGEREEVRAHLDGCPACREELAGLATTATALQHLAAGDTLVAAEEHGERGLLGRTLAELRRRRRRLRLRLAAVGVAMVVAAAGAAAGVTLLSRPGPPAAIPAAAHLAGANPFSGVVASADVYAESWGSSIHVTISGVSVGERCQLVAVSRDGSEEVAGSWHVGYGGKAQVDGATGMAPGQLASLRVITTRGAMLIALTMPSVSSS
jgi:predicted anti-sigma-YlaC factor YlaD